MSRKLTHIVDASALIAYFKNEAGHENFTSILKDEENFLAIHATNLCEVYYGYLRSDGIAIADQALELANSFLGILNILNEQFIKRVGRWKVDYNLSLGDAFAAASAEENACALLTTDRNDFSKIEEDGALAICWLR